MANGNQVWMRACMKRIPDESAVFSYLPPSVPPSMRPDSYVLVTPALTFLSPLLLNPVDRRECYSSTVVLRSPLAATLANRPVNGFRPAPGSSTSRCAWIASVTAPSADCAHMAAGACVRIWIASTGSRSAPSAACSRFFVAARSSASRRAARLSANLRAS
jgi:hypothetical protein